MLLWKKVEWMARELRWINDGEAIVNWMNAMEKVNAMIKGLEEIEIGKPGDSRRKPKHKLGFRNKHAGCQQIARLNDSHKLVREER